MRLKCKLLDLIDWYLPWSLLQNHTSANPHLLAVEKRILKTLNVLQLARLCPICECWVVETGERGMYWIVLILISSYSCSLGQTSSTVSTALTWASPPLSPSNCWPSRPSPTTGSPGSPAASSSARYQAPSSGPSPPTRSGGRRSVWPAPPSPCWAGAW